MGFTGFNICLTHRGDELLVHSLSSSGFNSEQALSWALNIWYSICETGMTLILDLDGSKPEQKQSYIQSLGRGGGGEEVFFSCSRKAENISLEHVQRRAMKVL